VSVYWGPETLVLRAKYRGPKTQVLWVKPSVRFSRSWNPGLESETQCPFVEVLKPRSWEPNAATRACRHGRIVSDRHGYPLVSNYWNYDTWIIWHFHCILKVARIKGGEQYYDSLDEILDPIFTKIRFWYLIMVRTQYFLVISWGGVKTLTLNLNVINTWNRVQCWSCS
jgi:hypothetical protein